MKYLVTGGSGFIGSHLCDRLLAEGHSVVCIDNNLTGSRKNVSHLLRNSAFTFLCVDAESPLDEQVDGIFHLASPTAPAQYQSNPLETLRANTVGTLGLLELAKLQKIPILYVSSIRVLDGLYPDKDSCYVEGKRMGELLCLNYGISAKVARLGNVYGPRMDFNDSRVIPTFIRKALLGQELTVFGDGSQLDSFCYVDDIVEGFYRFMVSGLSGVVEFGGEVISIKDLADKIAGFLGSKAVFTGGATRSRVLADSSRAIELLGWRKLVGLDEGLLKMALSSIFKRHSPERQTSLSTTTSPDS